MTRDDRWTVSHHCSELHLTGRRGRVGNKYACRQPSKLVVWVGTVMDRTWAMWGTVGAVRFETVDGDGDGDIGLGDYSPEQKRRAAEAGVGGFLATLVPPYRPGAAGLGRTPGHCVAGPVPCAKRGITSFPPLLLISHWLGDSGAC